MQDKEFDDLFRAKLEDFEHEPSGGVWAGVTAGLEKKTKRSIAPLLGIAASIAVLVTASILFIPRTTRIPVKSHTQNKTPEVARQNVPDKANGVSRDAENLTGGNPPKETAGANRQRGKKAGTQPRPFKATRLIRLKMLNSNLWLRHHNNIRKKLKP